MRGTTRETETMREREEARESHYCVTGTIIKRVSVREKITRPVREHRVRKKVREIASKIDKS